MQSFLGDREINEDYIASAENGTGMDFVLCDGLGGHGKGEVASEMAALQILQELKAHPQGGEQSIADAFEAAQKKLLAEQARQNMRNAMKTTAVVLRIGEKEAMWGHIGDSRLYLFYRNKLVLRTLDHSVPQMLVLAGDIKEMQIRNHPDRNRLLRVMGAEWSANRYEIAAPRDRSLCQAFLLCSDGFWECITEKEMVKCLKKSSSAADWMERMLEIVRKNGASQEMDNHSAITLLLE